MTDSVSELSDGVVNVLRSGEGRETERGYYAPASITLIKFPDSIHGCLVDTGSVREYKIIKESLKGHNISPRQIKKLFITHNHPDHIGTIGNFLYSKVYMPDSNFQVKEPNYFGLGMPENFYETPGNTIDIEELGKNHPDHGNLDLKFISTPGHAGWDLSFLYTGKNGRIAMIGDLFWSEEDWENDTQYRLLCVNPRMQEISRHYIREVLKPEIIVPGHGPAFKPKY